MPLGAAFAIRCQYDASARSALSAPRMANMRWVLNSTSMRVLSVRAHQFRQSAM